MCKKRTELGDFSDPRSVRKSVILLNVFDVLSSGLGTSEATKKSVKQAFFPEDSSVSSGRQGQLGDTRIHRMTHLEYWYGQLLNFLAPFFCL